MIKRTGGRFWSKEDEAELTRLWRVKKLQGMSDQAIADSLVEKLGRTRPAILGKATLLKLTVAAAKRSHDLLQAPVTRQS